MDHYSHYSIWSIIMDLLYCQRLMFPLSTSGWTIWLSGTCQCSAGLTWLRIPTLPQRIWSCELVDCSLFSTPWKKQKKYQSSRDWNKPKDTESINIVNEYSLKNCVKKATESINLSSENHKVQLVHGLPHSASRWKMMVKCYTWAGHNQLRPTKHI